jgi:GNAT superfamily N-acetyltransferase
MDIEIVVAESEEAIRSCFPALQVLRPHLDDEQAFVAQVRRQQAAGYRLVALREQDVVRSVAGFRMLEFLAWGLVLYIDDLITPPDGRRQGYAGTLLDWLIAHAREHGCAAVHLDSGYQRHDAHRLYLAKRLRLDCHHFALALSSPESSRP